MRGGICKRTCILALGVAFLCVFLGLGFTRADEPGLGERFGRLFRLGGNAPLQEARPAALPGSPPAAGGNSIVIGPPSTAALPGEASPRIIPQPRVSRSTTEADPLVTRVSIGRSDNGTHFGMFIQIYADGTVIDGDGVHQVGREALKPLLEAIRGAEVYRLRGHCGGPATDFIEEVHMVVYDRALGRLRASSFSFSGNPEGCDHSIRHIQAAIDLVQAKASGAAPASAPPPGTVEPGAPLPPPATSPARTTGGRTIPLSPLD
jgi:hypothetical protein